MPEGKGLTLRPGARDAAQRSWMRGAIQDPKCVTKGRKCDTADRLVICPHYRTRDQVTAQETVLWGYGGSGRGSGAPDLHRRATGQDSEGWRSTQPGAEMRHAETQLPLGRSVFRHKGWLCTRRLIDWLHTTAQETRSPTSQEGPVCTASTSFEGAERRLWFRGPPIASALSQP